MPKLPRIFSGVCLSAIALTACSHPAPPAQTQAAAPRYPVIVRLESRSYSIVISAGPKSPVYSIKDSDGQMLVDNASLGELHQYHPELYQILAPALAPEVSARADEKPVILSADLQ